MLFFLFRKKQKIQQAASRLGDQASSRVKLRKKNLTARTHARTTRQHTHSTRSNTEERLNLQIRYKRQDDLTLGGKPLFVIQIQRPFELRSVDVTLLHEHTNKSVKQHTFWLWSTLETSLVRLMEWRRLVSSTRRDNHLKKKKRAEIEYFRPWNYRVVAPGKVRTTLRIPSSTVQPFRMGEWAWLGL